MHRLHRLWFRPSSASPCPTASHCPEMEGGGIPSIGSMDPGRSTTHGNAETDGTALRVAERRKQSAYPELSQGGPQQLVVLGSEVGGRWNTEAQRFLRDLLRVRGATSPAGLAPGGARGLDSSLVGHAERGRATGGRDYGARTGLARPTASTPTRRSSTRARAGARSPGRLQPLAAARVSPRARAAAGL